MKLSPGDICLINIKTKNGEKTVKGLLLGLKEDVSLWLLVVYNKPEGPIVDAKHLVMFGQNLQQREVVYTSPCQGNVIVTRKSAVTRWIGSIDAAELSNVYCDIFACSQSPRLERFLNIQPSLRFTAPNRSLPCFRLIGTRRKTEEAPYAEPNV